MSSTEAPEIVITQTDEKPGERIFKVAVPTASNLLGEPEVTHRFNPVIRPLAQRGLVNIFELVSTTPAYDITSLLESDQQPGI